jgi:hypothetical protein
MMMMMMMMMMVMMMTRKRMGSRSHQPESSPALLPMRLLQLQLPPS